MPRSMSLRVSRPRDEAIPTIFRGLPRNADPETSGRNDIVFFPNDGGITRKIKIDLEYLFKIFNFNKKKAILT